MQVFISLVLVIAIPLLLKKLENTKFVKLFSPIALAYAAGIGLSFVNDLYSLPFIKSISEISIALSISLLVLDARFDKFKVLMKPALVAFSTGVISLFAATLICWFGWSHQMEHGADIMGMLTGVYVGGTPNMSAIGLALEVPAETFLMVNTAEVVYGGIYFLLLITVIKPLLSLFLPKYKSGESIAAANEKEASSENHSLKQMIFPILKNIGWAGLALGVSYGFVLLVWGEPKVSALLITLTTLSLAMAQNRKVKATPYKFDIADFLLLIFSFGIGCQIDMSTLFDQGAEIYWVVGVVFVLTILFHWIIAWILKIDADTLIISSTAALYGPAFIAPIAGAIKNRELIIYGITLGLLGYILGNYLGIMVATVLESWLAS